MALVFEDRDVLAAGPGLHAFIVGVSHYKHLADGSGALTADSFGMTQLSSTALSAFRVYEWLLKRRDRLPRPLATIHLLLSPSPGELAVASAMAGLGGRALRANFAADAKEWRKLAQRSEEEFAFFYFAGHGLARKQEDSVLLCEDFGDPNEGPLHNAVDHRHLFNGMAPPSRVTDKIARRQVYFVDACRARSASTSGSEPLNVPDLWNIGLPGADLRQAPIFYAAIPGTEAIERKNVQTFFSEALLACLEYDAVRAIDDEQDAEGNPKYGATVFALEEELKRRLAALNEKHGTQQAHSLTGRVANLTLHYLPGRPDVDVSVEVDPPADAPHVQYDVTDADDATVLSVRSLNPHPYLHTLPAGYYRFKASGATASFRSVAKFVEVQPPGYPFRAKVRR